MDPLTELCAVLRGSADVPAGAAGARVAALARRHRVDRLLAGRANDANRVDALIDHLSTRELRRVLGRLEAAGLAPLVFKGAALAHTHYPQSWMRPRLDTDILIAPESRARAIEILRDHGYQEAPVASGSLVSYQAMFVRSAEVDTEQVIDLHWQLTNPQLVAQTLSHAELLARADRITFADGGGMRVPSPVDALLIACLHRAAHHADADDLIWLYDIHLIASRLDTRQWSAFVAAAIGRSVAAISARGLSLARSRFDTRVPDEVMRQLLITDERSAIFLRRDLRPIDRLAADLASLGPRQRARLLREHVFPPAAYVRAKYGVQSRALLPALYAYRILAGAAKWLRRPSTPHPAR
jgi:hypothetical protein